MGVMLDRELVNITVAILIVGAILTFVETSFGRKSAWSLYIILVLSMLLTQPFLIARIASLLEQLRVDE